MADQRRSSRSTAFKATGNFPSSPQAYEDPAITGLENPFFNDAPVGQIFAAGAKSLKPQYLGPKNQAVRTDENALRTGRAGQAQTPDEAWTEAVKDAKKAAAK